MLPATKHARERRREVGLCVYCGQADPRPHKASCVPCGEIQAKRAQRYHERNPDKLRAYRKGLKARRRTLGLCTSCGKPRDPRSGWFCSACYERSRERSRKWGADERNKLSRRSSHLKSRYQLSDDAAVALAEAHKRACCEICGSTIRLDVDHDHETGQLRGFLCRRCNIMVGHIEKSPELPARAMCYVKRWREINQVARMEDVA